MQSRYFTPHFSFMDFVRPNYRRLLVQFFPARFHWTVTTTLPFSNFQYLVSRACSGILGLLECDQTIWRRFSQNLPSATAKPAESVHRTHGVLILRSFRYSETQASPDSGKGRFNSRAKYWRGPLDTRIMYVFFPWNRPNMHNPHLSTHWAWL